MTTLPRLCLLVCSLVVAASANAAKDPDTLVVGAKALRLYAAQKPDSVLARKAKPGERFLVQETDSLQYLVEFPDGSVARITNKPTFVSVLPGVQKPDPTPPPPPPAEEKPDPTLQKAKLVLAACGALFLTIVIVLWRMTRTDKHLFDEPKSPKAR